MAHRPALKRCLLAAVLLLAAACGGGGHGTPAAPVTTAPAPPSALKASAGDGQVTLSWAGSAGATGYLVQRATTSGGPYADLATLVATAFVDLGLADGSTYFYVVSALDGTVESAASAPVAATPLAPPAAPASLTAVPGNGQTTLTWPAASGAGSYQVGRSTVAGGPYSTIGTPAANTFLDTGLDNGKPYFYVVASVNEVATSAASIEAPSIPMAPPGGLVAVASDGQVGLFWAASAGATSYRVFTVAQGGATPTLMATTLSARFLDTGLANGTPRIYQVTAVNATGASDPSVQVGATPSATSIPLPPAEDPTRNRVGLGTWFMNDWDGSSAFVDVFKQSRFWQNAAWSSPAAADALGWPTQDASTVLMTGTPAVINGTYQLAFTGQATVSLMWSDGSVTGQTYDAASNTTTAQVTFALTASGSVGLVFTNTLRTPTSPVGSGFTQARLIRPGYPSDGSVVFTTPFLDAFRAANVQVVRMMDWDGGSSDLVQHWTDRATPQSATQAGLPAPSYTAPDGAGYTTLTGVALEHRIQLCNALMTDFWVNLPPLADQDYLTRTALTLRFGSDGANPYTSPQASPLYPPLNPSLRIYLEYANETWNSAWGFPTFHIEQAICEHLPADSPVRTPATTSIYDLMWRWPAYNIANISETFRAVFGDAAMLTRVRPVLETQQGDGQDTLGQALEWLEAYAPTLATPRTVATLLYGGGGSAYYGVIDNLSALPDAFFAPSNYPDPGTLAAFATDAVWTGNYGIRHVAYEGGPGLDFSDGDNRTLNADPRMATLMMTMHDAWSAMGGDLLTYYCLRGPSNWECTPDMTVSATPKLAALAAITASPRAAVTLGAALPGTIVVTAPAAQGVSWGGFDYTITIDGLSCRAGIEAGESLAYPGHASATGTHALTLTGTANVDTQVAVWVNGVPQGTVTLAAATGSGLDTSTPVQVELPAGLDVIRLTVLSGSLALYSLTVQD